MPANSATQATVQIALVGDLHGDFDQEDLDYFNQSDDDLLLFVGDLGTFLRPREAMRIVRKLARLAKPALLIPGNHDVHNRLLFLASALHISWLERLTARSQPQHHRRLREMLQPVTLAAYSQHPFAFRSLAFDVIAGRPYSFGGPELDLAPFLASEYDVHSLEESAALIKQQVDQATSDRLIFLAHNGPHGLGDEPAAIWGADFDPKRGDWGDPDLSEAISYARQQGKEVLAVVSGHMHRLTKQGVERPWHIEHEGAHYLNTARVPRIIPVAGGYRREHLRLTLTPEGATVSRQLAPDHARLGSG